MEEEIYAMELMGKLKIMKILLCLTTEKLNLGIF